MANFQGVYVKLGHIDSAEFFIWTYGVVFLVTKFRSDTTRQCSVTAELKYAILQYIWANKGPTTIFTSMCVSTTYGSAWMFRQNNGFRDSVGTTLGLTVQAS